MDKYSHEHTDRQTDRQTSGLVVIMASLKENRTAVMD